MAETGTKTADIGTLVSQASGEMSRSIRYTAQVSQASPEDLQSQLEAITREQLEEILRRSPALGVIIIEALPEGGHRIETLQKSTR